MNPLMIMFALWGIVLAVFLGFGIYAFLKPFRKGYVRLRIVHPDRTRRTYLKQIKMSGAQAENSNETVMIATALGIDYHVASDCIIHEGWQRVPTLSYFYGRFEPVNYASMALDSALSGKDYHDAIEAHVASDVIKSLKPASALTPALSMIIVIAIMVGGFGVVYMTQNKGFDRVVNHLYASQGLPLPEK